MKFISDECVVQLVVIDKNCLYTMAITETPLSITIFCIMACTDNIVVHFHGKFSDFRIKIKYIGVI